LTLTLPLNDSLKEQLIQEALRSGLSPEQYSAQVLAQHLEETRKHRETVQKLESLLDGDDEEQRSTGEELIQSLEQHRLSSRTLFPAELKDVTW
jgi:hypothetical protein